MVVANVVSEPDMKVLPSLLVVDKSTSTGRA